MRTAHTVEAVRSAEAVMMGRLPDGALMQRAAAGLATRAARLLGGCYGRRVVVLVGSGDNGGDALFAGARLAGRGARVQALLVTGRAHAGGLAALLSAGGRASPVAGEAPVAADAALDHADLVLDGIVGIGGRGPLRPEAALRVARAEAGPGRLVAVDVPSGVDAGTGTVSGAVVHADVTVTFGAYKPGLLVDPGAGCAGAVELVDIGLGPLLPAPRAEVLQAADVAARLPVPVATSDKYRRGVLGIVAGSPAYPGAPVLTTGGALRTGTGMVRFVSDAATAAAVRARWPEAVVTEVPRGDGAAVLAAGQVQAWAVGPGMGTDDRAATVLAALLGTELPVVADADALTLLSRRAELRTRLFERRAATLLTPHAGELARLLDVERADVEARRLEQAERAAARLGAVVLLKGSTTVVASPDGRLRLNPTGTPHLATAGSGDVLTGMCGALLAGGLDAADAGSVAAWLHGLAGRIAGRVGVPIASDVLAAVPAAIRTGTRLGDWRA
jgi:hydroxyethylthiazole kinase-like uncharacterized protein yjeF